MGTRKGTAPKVSDSEHAPSGSPSATIRVAVKVQPMVSHKVPQGISEPEADDLETHDLNVCLGRCGHCECHPCQLHRCV